MGYESRQKQNKVRRVIYVEQCVLCPLYDGDAQECTKLHREVKCWHAIDPDCPLAIETA